MYLCYVDDSAEESTHQIIGAVIVPDEQFMVVEEYLGYIIELHVPEDLRSKFEFHASDLFHGKPPFDKIARDEAFSIISKCAGMIADAPLPIVYGAVDLRKQRGGLYATASPVDVAFRLCLPEINRWFETRGLGREDFGIIIADNTKNSHHKTQMQEAFRAHRRRAKPVEREGEISAIERGRLKYIHDDMYFGDSAYSAGIQIADIACFIVLRHLQGKQDTESLYRKIEKAIFSAKVEPQ